MCGIAGYFGTKTISEDRLDQCLGRMRRRGPDSATYRHWANNAGRQAYLLHSRLSIIDLDDRSNQPFHIAPKWMAFNGELYNYVEVRNELVSQGHAFRTTSDTEVLLRAIHHSGWSCLDRCEGMWAFAVYDEAEGSLTLSRDRFGEKPLFVYRDDDGVYFGSEVKFIAALRGKPLEVNFDHLYRYMVNGYKALYKDGHCFYKGLTEVPAASTLHFDLTGRETSGNYWKPVFQPDDRMTYAEAVAGAHSFRRAAAARRRAAGVLHERRRRFQCADQHRQEELQVRRARLHHRQHRQAL
jgi:asparagine synthase (glutamine-hydrolysing)